MISVFISVYIYLSVSASVCISGHILGDSFIILFPWFVFKDDAGSNWITNLPVCLVILVFTSLSGYPFSLGRHNMSLVLLV